MLPTLSLSPARRRVLLAGVAVVGLAAAAGVPALAAPGRTAAVQSVTTAGDRTADVRAAIEGGRARNVILFIGDGMGDSEITIARNYARGAAGRLALDTLPLTGAYTTYAVRKDDPAKPDYVTDSAASGTGWATGHKTYNGAISVDPAGNPLPTILELAKRNGYRTGDVTTAEVQDAPRPCSPRTWSAATARARRRPPPSARRTRSRTAAPARSASRWSRPGRTSSWAAARSTSTRRSPPGGTRARPGYSRPPRPATRSRRPRPTSPG